MIKYPGPDRPRHERDVDERIRGAEEKWTCSIHLRRELFQVASKLLGRAQQPIFCIPGPDAAWLELQVVVKRGDDVRRDVVDPDAGAGIGVSWQQARSVVWVCVVKECAKHGGFVEELVVVL